MSGDRNQPMESPQHRVATALVLGGGLAGMAAAIRLQEAGLHVTLLEARATLGGRAGSIPINATEEAHVAAPRGATVDRDDPTSGGGTTADYAAPELIDQAQHVLLGCCTNLIDFYQRLGVDGQIEWHDHYRIVDRQGNFLRLSRSRLLPAPLHFAFSSIFFSGIPLQDRLAIARGVLQLIRTDQCARPFGLIEQPDASTAAWSADASRESFGQWLARHEQSATTVRLFWNPVIESACNATVDQVRADTGRQVFLEGVLRHRAAACLGLSRCALAELYEPLRQHVASVHTGERVTQVEQIAASGADDGPRFLVATRAGRSYAADAVVFALPFVQIHQTLGPGLQRVADELLHVPATFSFSPILNLHLFFDHPLVRSRTAIYPIALMDRPVHWFFLRNEGRHVHVVVSAADSLVDAPRDLLEHLAIRELARALRRCPHRTADRVHGFTGADLGPGADESNLARSLRSLRVIRERRATFVPSTQAETVRPGPRTAVPGFVLAGDWCRTGWPATMEGAVRGGYAAAEAVLDLPAGSLTKPCLPPGPLYRLLSGEG